MGSAGGGLRRQIDGRVVTLTLDRPAVLNALDSALRSELAAALDQAAADPAVGAVVLTGAGRAFCVGQDLAEVQPPDDPGAGGETGEGLAAELRRSYNPLILALHGLEKPTVAALNGVAAGAGMSLALACDIRLAAADASFVAAFGRIGLVPDSGMSWFLPRLVGPGRAAEILLAGLPVSAAEAERIGLVNRVLPAGSLQAEAGALARQLAEGAPLAAALTKRALDVGLRVGLAEALDLEAQLQGVAGRSADHAEGLAAFREKRQPRFGMR